MPNYIKVTIHNNTGKVMYAVAHRSDPGGNGPWITPIASANPAWGAFDAKQCNLKLPTGASTSFNYPNDNGMGARLFVSDPKLSGVPDLMTALFIYDKVEMTFNGVWNTSNVDFFGIPMQLNSGGTSVGFNNNVTRKQVMSALGKTPHPFDTYRKPITGNTIYRWFAPSKQAPGNIWKTTIANGLSKLSGQSITYGTTTYAFGKATANSILVTAGGTTVKVNNIDTMGAIQGTLPQGRAGALIGAALNRGVLHDTTLWGNPGGGGGNPANYYQISTDNGGLFNYYSKVLHDFSINNQCYGFSYDDYFAQAAAVTVNGNQAGGASVEIVLLPF